MLGHVAKEYPNVAKSAIPTFVDLLDVDANRLRANAGRVLAELADEYQEQLRHAIPIVIELLDDEDEKARYNVTSILARVAKEHPETVQPAIGGLVEMLYDEFPYSRSNACWALGYLEATDARKAIEDLKRSDKNDEVTAAADWALNQLE